MVIFKKTLILLLIIFSHQLYCCDCKDYRTLDTLRYVSYVDSDLIFYGELIDYDTIDYTYTFRIIELFKGESKTKLIKGKSFTSCSLFPMDKCEWLVYANYIESDIINISGCLISRSEIHPQNVQCYTPPPPQLPSEHRNKKSEIDYEKWNLENFKRAKKDFEDEILILRKRKKCQHTTRAHKP